jgi:hypothetical protein
MFAIFFAFKILHDKSIFEANSEYVKNWQTQVYKLTVSMGRTELHVKNLRHSASLPAENILLKEETRFCCRLCLIVAKRKITAMLLFGGLAIGGCI